SLLHLKVEPSDYWGRYTQTVGAVTTACDEENFECDCSAGPSPGRANRCRLGGASRNRGRRSQSATPMRSYRFSGTSQPWKPAFKCRWTVDRRCHRKRVCELGIRRQPGPSPPSPLALDNLSRASRRARAKHGNYTHVLRGT